MEVTTSPNSDRHRLSKPYPHRRKAIVGGYAAIAVAWVMMSGGLLAWVLAADGLPGSGVWAAVQLADSRQACAAVVVVAGAAVGIYWLMLRAVRDIGMAEAARDRAQPRLGPVLDSIPDHAVLLLAPDGTIVDCNRAVAALLGWQPMELIGSHLSRLHAEQDLAPGTVDQLLAGAAGGRFEHDFWQRRKDGSRFWANVVMSRLVDDSGRLVGFSNVIRDMTERRQAEELLHANEERLRESERRTRLMMDSSVDGIVTIDEHGFIESFSGAAARIFGYAAEDVIGRNVSVLMPEPDRGRHDGYLQRYIETGERRVIGLGREVQGLRSDGSVFPMDLAVSEVYFGRGQRRFVGTVRDLTERRGIEAQLRQAQKMEAVGQLTGGLAHDFNNLLSVTIGCAEMLQHRLTRDAQGARLCAAILEAGKRGADLTNRLLGFSRRQALQPVAVDLSELLVGLHDLLSRTLGEDIDVMMTLPKGLPKAIVDPAQVENAVLNLAINARDAMPDGGTLTIAVEHARLEEDYARQNPGVIAGDCLMISVSDTGGGMLPEVLEHAFDPFFTTKPVGKGTGLGLSMVYGFARQSGGHAKIYSEVGIGTTVRLYLPQAEEAAGSPPRALAPAEVEVPTGRETILLAEDDTLVRRYVTGQLVALGYTVISTSDGPTALTEIESGRPIDLLLTDVVMPGGMTGRELAEAALLRRPDLKVLFTTGYTEDVMVLQGKLAPGTHILNKPFGRAALARKLRAVIEE